VILHNRFTDLHDSGRTVVKPDVRCCCSADERRP
jgi:hypothetical protein